MTYFGKKYFSSKWFSLWTDFRVVYWQEIRAHCSVCGYCVFLAINKKVNFVHCNLSNHNRPRLEIVNSGERNIRLQM